MIDEKSVRLLPGVSVREFSEALLAVEWRDPSVKHECSSGSEVFVGTARRLGEADNEHATGR
jgi:hypothetical protein